MVWPKVALLADVARAVFIPLGGYDARILEQSVQKSAMAVCEDGKASHVSKLATATARCFAIGSAL